MLSRKADLIFTRFQKGVLRWDENIPFLLTNYYSPLEKNEKCSENNALTHTFYSAEESALWKRR